jgi:hypothetical protein
VACIAGVLIAIGAGAAGDPVRWTELSRVGLAWGVVGLVLGLALAPRRRRNPGTLLGLAVLASSLGGVSMLATMGYEGMCHGSCGETSSNWYYASVMMLIGASFAMASFTAARRRVIESGRSLLLFPAFVLAVCTGVLGLWGLVTQMAPPR